MNLSWSMEEQIVFSWSLYGSLSATRNESPLSQEIISHRQYPQQTDAAESPAYLKLLKQAAEVALLPLHRAGAHSPGKLCWDKQTSKMYKPVISELQQVLLPLSSCERHAALLLCLKYLWSSCLHSKRCLLVRLSLVSLNLAFRDL